MDYQSNGQRRKGLWLLLGLMIISFALISACGGGGSSGSSGGSSGLSYSGSTVQAEIDATNAGQLSANVMTVGSNSTAFGAVGSLEKQSGENGFEPFILPAMATAMKDAVHQMDLSQTKSYNLSAAVQTEEGTLEGECAAGANGSGTYSIRVDDSTGVFTGSMVFSDFCVDRTVIDGTTSFSGTVNVQTEEMQEFTFTFDALTVSSGDQLSFTFDGSITMSMDSTEAGTIMNMLVRNDLTGDVYQVVNYTMTVTDYYSYEAIEISGTFYDPDNGYVTVSTPEPLLYTSSATYPYSGQMVLTGSESGARLTAVSATTCQVEVDEDGDGTYEYDSGEISWTQLRLLGLASQ